MKKQFILLIALFIIGKSFSQVIIKSYNKANINKRGLFGLNETITETIIPEIENDNKITSKTYKFGKIQPVNIYPLKQAFKEILESQLIVYRQKIIAQNATSIKISFDVLTLSENAELYIYNPEGTIITGPITAKENTNPGRLWSSNSFPGNTIILELKIPKKEDDYNFLHASQLLFGYPVKDELNILDSTAFGNFNSSSSCNINVTCSQGNAFVNERKAICYIETNDGGSCSGTLINNACNYNKPYLLTAWHCTNGANPNNWTFIFGWSSSTCSPSTYNQQALLFNGATLRATYEQTDFSLLELFQTPGSNSDLTYLGWSRSSSPPAISVGIHHPKGDQMKISFENNPASIGNINTYTNNAWRVLWDQGIVEKGSSGSPLLDQNKKVIGQLYSNTQPSGPTCNIQTGGTNYGRFDLSWVGGGTNATRLSNWLDPSNSGATTTNTTNILNLIDPSALISITGANGFCSGTSVYFVNAPLGSAVSWASSNTAIASVSPTGNTATVTRTGIGTVTLTATITYCGAAPVVVTKVIHIGPYTSSDYTFSGNNGSPLYCTNQTISFTLNGAFGSNYVWSVPTGWTTIYNGGSNYITIKAPSGTYPPTGTLSVSFTEPCGSIVTASTFLAYSSGACSGDPRYTYSPNPAPATLNVAVASAYLGNTWIRKIELVNTNTGASVYFQDYTYGNVTNTSINMSGYPSGTYTLRIYDGSAWATYSIVH